MANGEGSMGKVIAQAWSDETFRKELLADPASALKRHGFEVPQGVEVRVVEDTPARRTLVIPPQPQELSDEALDAVAGGGWGSPPSQGPAMWP